MSSKSKAAYFLVDMSELPAEAKQSIIEDAMAGGGEYGVRIVEEVHNGPARQNIFGVYYGADEAKWTEAKKDLGIKGSEMDDAEVTVESNDSDPRQEAAIRQQAEEAALAEADRIRTAEQAEIQAITKVESTEEKPVNKMKK